ncbi:MAG: hypothetical protein Ta2B_08790 [Termitinemataceae bacterium]|nr:MAG: hypothetical protein Ta2B_08790 [Termitinemataceae bacterium]
MGSITKKYFIKTTNNYLIRITSFQMNYGMSNMNTNFLFKDIKHTCTKIKRD